MAESKITTPRKSRLGRGLAGLVVDSTRGAAASDSYVPVTNDPALANQAIKAEPPGQAGYQDIPADQIAANPYQPRREFRAEELADDADVRLTPPRWATVGNQERPAEANTARVPVTTDPRLPPPGGQITRRYKGRSITVTVLVDGFEYLGERYRSLTAVAKAITGSHMSGFQFFGLESVR